MPRFTKMEFPGLYREFIDSGYLGSLDGMRHLNAYEEERIRGTAQLPIRVGGEAEGRGRDGLGPPQVAAPQRHGGESGEGRVGTHRPRDPGKRQEFRVADVYLPAGSQVLRFHARQVLRPVGGDPRSFEVGFFAPLAGFVLAPSGQSQMSVSVTFPPAWVAPGISIGTPVITPLPGQTAPPEQPSGPTYIAERPIYGWLWRNDPKVTITYGYA